MELLCKKILNVSLDEKNTTQIDDLSANNHMLFLKLHDISNAVSGDAVEDVVIHTEFLRVKKIGKKRLLIRSISKLDEYDMTANLKGKKQPNIKKNTNSQLITSHNGGCQLIESTVGAFDMFELDNLNFNRCDVGANCIHLIPLANIIFVILTNSEKCQHRFAGVDMPEGYDVKKLKCCSSKKKRKIFKISCRSMIYKINSINPLGIFFSMSNSIIWFKTKSAILSS